MVMLKGTDSSELLRATNVEDAIHGLTGNDTLWGLGGSDTIDGGEGDDVIEGDGAYTVADAVREFGTASIAFSGRVSSTSGLQLTSMGRTVDLDGDKMSVWRIRNATEKELTVVLQPASGGTALKLVVAPKSDTLVNSADFGTQVLVYNGSKVDVKAAGTQAFSYSQAYGTTIDGEDLLSGRAGNDVIRGWGGDDALDGGSGSDSLDGGSSNDILAGGEGSDKLIGGTGIDRADYLNSKEGVIVDLSSGKGSGGDAEGDYLSGIENISGSNASDVLTGDDGVNRLVGRQGNDELHGGGGNDVLLGGSGADLLNGGDGIDTADYSGSWTGVNVDLLNNKGAGGEARGDTFKSIENLVGSRFNDVLAGDDGANRLTGGDGNDTLVGNGGNDVFVGGAGADTLDGGEGDRDVADYSGAKESIGIDLLKGGFAGDASDDAYKGIEFVYGSSSDDKMFGDDGVNRLVGNAGDDLLDGRGGNDYLLGGAGNDTMTGGNGQDVFVFEKAAFGNDIITDFEAGAGRTDRIQLIGQGAGSFEELLSRAGDTGDGIILKLDSGTIMLSGLKLEQLHSDDFLFL